MSASFFYKMSFLATAIFISGVASGQAVYKLGDKVQNFATPVILNNDGAAVTSLYQIKQRIIILDFFGTWCGPCITALLHLTALQQKYKQQLAIILLSNEQKAKLEKFVAARQPFAFPVIVDNENSISNLFKPPSYPYTVVMDAQKNIIALTDASSITEEKIEQWLAVKSEAVIAAVPSPVITKKETVSAINLNSSNKLVQFSQQFMYAAKSGDSTTRFILQLRTLNYTELLTSLQSDEEKKAFWINLYNAFTQALLQQNPDSYKKRSKFFSSKQIIVAGKNFSLDDIEHGILRRSKIKWSLGYFSKLLPGKTEKQLRVNKLDYRLHFALNCGAKSCPPIAFYSPESINPQLQLAARAYLQSEAAYNAAANTLQLPAIMSWFRRDFGGKKKMLQLLKDNQLIPAAANPKITFKPYDWTLYLNNFKK